MPSIKVRQTDLPVTGGLGFSLPSAAVRASARYVFEAAMSDIPASSRRFFFDPDWVTLDGVPTVVGLRNILSNVNFVEGAALPIRDATVPSSQRPTIGTFAGGATAIVASGTGMEPFSVPYTLNTTAHTIFGVARIGGLAVDVVGVVAPTGTPFNLTGVGVQLRKETTPHPLRYYFNGATDFIESAGPGGAGGWADKTVLYMLTYDAAVGRRLWLNNVMVGENLTTAGRAVPTITSFQMFGTSAFRNKMAGRHGFGGMVDVDLGSSTYAAVRDAMWTYAQATYPIGA